MPLALAVALGGAVGSVARWWIGEAARAAHVAAPLGTLVVNVVGSFALGVLARWLLATDASPELRLALTVGVCGGFTTFSTFSHETAMLIDGGNYGRAAAYVTASVVLSLAATFAGFGVARAALTTP